jgi:hypothetical protein
MTLNPPILVPKSYRFTNKSKKQPKNRVCLNLTADFQAVRVPVTPEEEARALSMLQELIQMATKQERTLEYELNPGKEPLPHGSASDPGPEQPGCFLLVTGRGSFMPPLQGGAQ